MGARMRVTHCNRHVAERVSSPDDSQTEVPWIG
jgi:hypothetical protein